MNLEFVLINAHVINQFISVINLTHFLKDIVLVFFCSYLFLFVSVQHPCMIYSDRLRGELCAVFKISLLLSRASTKSTTLTQRRLSAEDLLIFKILVSV